MNFQTSLIGLPPFGKPSAGCRSLQGSPVRQPVLQEDSTCPMDSSSVLHSANRGRLFWLHEKRSEGADSLEAILNHVLFQAQEHYIA